MIENIMVVRREPVMDLAKLFKKPKKLAIISICSYKRDILFTEAVKKQMDCENIISFVFADLTEADYKVSPSLTKTYPRFNVKMAHDIIEFINNIKEKDIKLLLIHCDAGISRSGAVGVWAIRYLGMDENIFRKEHPYIGPNTLVYDTLSKVSGLREGYANWWEDIDFNPDIIF